MSAEGVMASNSEVHKGENARMSSFVGAIAIADLVKTTLGPKGMDKILQSVGDPNNMKITITNDGATILKSVPVDNPAAKVLVEIAKTQDDTVGDGTTSVAVLCGELLREAEFLVQVHGLDCLTSFRVTPPQPVDPQPCLPICLCLPVAATRAPDDDHGRVAHRRRHRPRGPGESHRGPLVRRQGTLSAHPQPHLLYVLFCPPLLPLVLS